MTTPPVWRFDCDGIEVDVTVSEDALGRLAAKAAHNDTGRARSGPAKATVARKSRAEHKRRTAARKAEKEHRREENRRREEGLKTW